MSTPDPSARLADPGHSSVDVRTTVLVGLREIWAHKFRSLLTMLGIVLGVASLVAMSALVKGMENGAKEALIAVGGLEKVRVEPQELPVYQRHLADQAMGITVNDVRALQHGAPLVTQVSPEMRVYATVSANGKRFRPFICNGVWPVALEMSEHELEHGRMFNEIDDETARSVCVIGTATRDELWGSPEETGEEIVPLGELIYINGVPFTIIGMFKHYESEQERREREQALLEAKKTGQPVATNRGRSRRRGRSHFIFWLKNATIYMPLNTAYMKFRSGVSYGEGSGATGDPRLSNLELKIESVDLLNESLQQIRNVLMGTHKGIEDFTFRTQEDWAENIEIFVRNARMSGGMIAGIALLVGGIGIMNIMLASISERVREIGIRKSVGATTSDVFIQILVEALVIAVLGGVAGLVASFLLVQLIGSFAPGENLPVITVPAMLVAFGFSALVGVLAGIVPGVKAARLDPIQALRYE